MPSIRASFIGLLLAVTVVATPARASDKAAAEALFQAGKQLMDAGRLEEACPKLAASMQEDPSPGTMLNLALCHEKQGKIATAWAEYTEAAALAKQRGESARADVAQEFSAKLEPRLSRLAIDVTAPVSGLEITRDGQRVLPASFGVGVPVDPGTHEIVARAPGYLEWSTRVSLTGEAQQQQVAVPQLRPVGREKGPRPLLVAGIALASVGAAGLVVGGVFGGLASSNQSEADADCPDLACTVEAFDTIESARGLAHGATAAFVIGGVVAATGLALILVDVGGSSGDSIALAPYCHDRGCGIAGWGTF